MCPRVRPNRATVEAEARAYIEESSWKLKDRTFVPVSLLRDLLALLPEVPRPPRRRKTKTP